MAKKNIAACIMRRIVIPCRKSSVIVRASKTKMGECELPSAVATFSHFHRETESRPASHSIAHYRLTIIAPQLCDGKFQIVFLWPRVRFDWGCNDLRKSMDCEIWSGRRALANNSIAGPSLTLRVMNNTGCHLAKACGHTWIIKRILAIHLAFRTELGRIRLIGEVAEWSKAPDC